MSQSNYEFTVKFFRPSQRTVPSHNGFLDTRSKHIVAKDRFVVAEQRMLDAERQKSVNNLQILAYEQKQLEKRLSSLHNLDQSIQIRHRSTSEVNLHNIHRSNSSNDTPNIHHSKLYENLFNSEQNLLSLPKNVEFQRRFSACFDDDGSENLIIHSDTESDEEGNHSRPKKKQAIPPPLVTIIPPEEDAIQ